MSKFTIDGTEYNEEQLAENAKLHCRKLVEIDREIAQRRVNEGDVIVNLDDSESDESGSGGWERDYDSQELRELRVNRQPAKTGEEMDEDEFQDFLADYIDNKKKAMEKDSDAPGNVITFKPKKDVFH